MSLSEAEVLHDQMEARQVIIAISGMALGPTGYEIVCVCVCVCVCMCMPQTQGCSVRTPVVPEDPSQLR